MPRSSAATSQRSNRWVATSPWWATAARSWDRSTTPWHGAGRPSAIATGPAPRRPPPTSWRPGPGRCCGSPASRRSRSASPDRSPQRLDRQGILLGEDLVDQAVGDGVFAAQDEVPVDVDRDLLDRLAGVLG